MNMTAQVQAKLASRPSFTPVRTNLLQRTCACGGTSGQDGECAECRRKRLSGQRYYTSPGEPATVPPIVHEVLNSPGRPLDSTTRDFMEARFGHDFGQVRVHTDARAAVATRALAADAFTIGRDIFFDQGCFSPNTISGHQLVAHELAHTVQQSAAPVSSLAAIDDEPLQEAEAERAARTVTSEQSSPVRLELARSRRTPAIQRKVRVNNPAGAPAGAPVGETNEKIVKGYVIALCPDFTTTAGHVAPITAAFCATGVAASSAPEACGCLCKMHNLRDPATGADIVWTIDVNDKVWPHTDPATNTVTVHSPYSGMQFGAWAKGPPAHRMTQSNWLVLGHELCGHAQLFVTGTHPTGPPPRHGGRPSHDVTVQIENKIALEHGIPASDLRGLFADPHHGESFARVTIARFPSNSADVAALPSAERRQLDIAEAFIKSAAVKMDIIGHADLVASSAAANTAIAGRRADNVKAQLVGRGISAARFLAVNGVGASECSSPGDQPSCRKVDIFMFIMEGASVTHP